MSLLGKVDAILLVALGALGWVLQTNDRDEAVVLGLVVLACGIIGLCSLIVLQFVGGHQAPDLAASAHLLPWFFRAAALVAFGWAGAWCASKAGVESTELAGAAGVVVFGAVAKALETVTPLVDVLRPVSIGERCIRAHYEGRFDVQPGEVDRRLIAARNASTETTFDVSERGDTRSTVSGWCIAARVRRLQLIGAYLDPTGSTERRARTDG